MSRRSRRRRREKRRKKETKALARQGIVVTRVYLRMEQLEVARGHDGFLRGLPEPTLLVGVYGIASEGARVLGRFLYRFEHPEGFPSKVAPKRSSHESVVAPLGEHDRVALVLLAVEEDSGRGLERLYAGLERVDGVVTWTDDATVPEPRHLSELRGGVVAGRGHRVHLLLGEHDPTRELEGDDWVDANLLLLEPGLGTVRHRLHFVSACGRNDWTAEISVRASRA